MGTWRIGGVPVLRDEGTGDASREVDTILGTEPSGAGDGEARPEIDTGTGREGSERFSDMTARLTV